MLSDEIFGRWAHLKNNVQHLFHNLNDKLHSHKEEHVDQIHIDNYHYESHRLDRLDLTQDISGEETEIFYSDTENSEFSRGKPRAPARGIDSFGENDSIDSEMRH